MYDGIKVRTEFVREMLHEIIKPVVIASNDYIHNENRPVPPALDVAVLLLGTALAESGLREIRQGPTDEAHDALSFWQIEPATHLDIWHNFLLYRPRLQHAIEISTGMRISCCDMSAPDWWLSANARYACWMARVCYMREPDKIPNLLTAKSITPFAALWKKIYNTAGGKGTEAHFLKAWMGEVEEVKL